MSKGSVQRKSTTKRDPSIGDEEINRRRPCYQLVEKERQRKMLTTNDIRKNQLGILQDILFNERNGNIKFIPKNNIIRNGKNSKTRSTSAKTSNSWNQSEEGLNEYLSCRDDNQSVHSVGEEIIENKPVRVSRSNKKDDQQHRMTRSQSRAHSNGIRSTQNVSFLSDKSKNGLESNINASPRQFKKLLVRLSSEFNDLDLTTGFKPNKNDPSPNTSLATALIRLTGHVKQCTLNSKEINNLKEQLSMVIKTQLDFQEKVDNQITTLQTMMQTICQLINNGMISNQTDFQFSKTQQNWLNNAQRPYLIPKDTNNAMDELLLFTRRMNNATPIDSNLFRPSPDTRHSAFMETLEASKKLTQQTPFLSTNDSYDMFHSGLSSGNLSGRIVRNEISTSIPAASMSETVLEKILQERLRLVQQMAELNKQHEITQEELANLETKTIQT